MANNNNMTILLIAGIVLAIFWFSGGIPQATTNEEKEEVVEVPVVGCGVEDVAFTPKMTRTGKSGTALTGASENYYITTDALGSTNGGSSITVPVGYEMEVLFGEASSTYYTKVEDVSVACADPFYMSTELPQAETTLASFYSENSDGTVNSGSNKEALGADDIFETTVTIKASSDQYFGNPNSECDNIAVAEYDKTYILKVTGDDPAPVPGKFSYLGSTWDGSNAFIVPKVADGEKAEFNVKIESSSSDPTSEVVQLTLYDCDIDKNEDSLALIHGVEDEDLNDISLATQKINISIS